MRVKSLAQEHNTMSLASAWTCTARSRHKRKNHMATTPPQMQLLNPKQGKFHPTTLLVLPELFGTCLRSVSCTMNFVLCQYVISLKSRSSMTTK